ncbi:MAG TPA: glycoside hydrolase family 2 TIM barrel-domain containing protein [Sedimentisphaerales bacterium]|nr:glycoside hydrolase family 2 TIM barrel-domain containing protein [Sedimentisphaerales bacterium]
MLRMFAEHRVRPAASLPAAWDFIVEKDLAAKGRLPQRYNRTIVVPSCWEQIPGLETYRGIGWFRTNFCAPEAKAVRLVFGGVSHTATVYVDGRKVGWHYDAYTPWDVVLPNLKAGQHELVLKVDNTFSDDSALHRDSDYYTYGGITRPAEIQYVPHLYIDKIFARPFCKAGKWNLDVRVKLRNCGKSAVSRRLRLRLGDSVLDVGRVNIAGGKTRDVKAVMNDLDVREWNEKTPNLYCLAAELLDGQTVVDDLIDRVGFREMVVKGNKMLLNGRPLQLRGFNRHEDHGNFGCALPPQAMATDLELMRDMCCNFVRTSHYPNDMRFLDLCDEMGFLVWEEGHYRNVPLDHPLFREQYGRNLEEMVEWHYNRPSIIIWGCLNESDSASTFGRRQHAWALGLLRMLDSSRPVTFADFKHQKSTSQGCSDIVSWNRYDAWYVGGLPEILIRIKRMKKWLASPKSCGGKGKPIIMSEFGAAAIYGYHHPSECKWTEKYQAQVLDESLRVYLSEPGIIGVAIWQFCDCRVIQGGDKGHWNTRPRCHNNKGVVDEFRRRKMSYEAVKRRMKEAALRHQRHG